jgi:hypothetical protein
VHRFSDVEPRLFDLQDDSLFRVNRTGNAFEGRGMNFSSHRISAILPRRRVNSFQTVFKVAQLALGKGKVFDLQGFTIELAAVPDACMIDPRGMVTNRDRKHA